MKTSSIVRAVIASGLTLAGVHQASAVRIFGLTTSNEINVFESSSTSLILSSGEVAGLNAGDRLIAPDYQAASGILILLGSQSTVYKLDSISGSSFTATLLKFLDPFVPG